jgi:cell division protein FtsI/penicillin-binding protein 2
MDNGYVYVSKKKISNFDGKGRGKVDMQKVIDDSLNTGAVFIEQSLGREMFSSYFKAFGLGEKTEIDLPNEVSGLIDNLDSKYDVDQATAAFGQGIALSPMEIIRALGAIANGGYLIRPSVTDSIRYDSGVVKTIEPLVQGRAIKKETAQEVSRMLVRAYDEALLGGTLKLDGYSIAAKTGTAQIPKPGGGYYDDRTLHSFFGYFPAYNPRFLVFLYINNPKGIKYANQTLAVPFSEIAKFLIGYYDIPPDRYAGKNNMLKLSK